MPIRTLAHANTTARTVARRFWGLLLAILCLATIFSAVAVEMTSAPFLHRIQAETIREQGRKDARNLDAILAKNRLMLTLLARNPDVVSRALGDVDSSERANDHLRGMPWTENFEWVSLHDAFGKPLAGFNANGGWARDFDAATLQGLIDGVLDETAEAGRQVVIAQGERFAHLALAVPVRQGGLVEGALVVGLVVDLTRMFPPNETAQRTYFVQTDAQGLPLQHVPPEAIVVPLDGVMLAAVLIPDWRSITDAGRWLARNTVTAVATVLLIAFAAFAVIGHSTIVTPHQRLEAQKRALAELAAVAERANEAIAVTDLGGRIAWVNPAFGALTGYPIEEVRGRRPGDFLQGPDTDPATVEEMRRALDTRRPIKVEIVNYHKTGIPYWVSISISLLRDETGRPYGFMAVSQDITAAREQQDAILAAKTKIEFQALHDPLTGLANRRAFDLAIADRQASANPAATVVRIDLDHFKYVNDTLGHQTGDFVLCEVARILQDEAGTTALPVRIGGDEFVLLLSAGTTAEDGAELAERILDRLRQPLTFEGKIIRYGGSFGVASTHDGLLPLEDLIIGADAALYEAKDMGRNRVRCYAAALHETVIGRRELAYEIRKAVANAEFEPYFQLQFDARTHRISGAEALARWRSPSLGLVMPDVFFPVARQLSMVEEIDQVMFRKAMDQIHGLRRAGVVIPKISFNVTAERIQNPESFASLLERRTDGVQVALEVLESVLVEDQNDCFRFNLDRLREAGVLIEVDDFGSGHASIIGLLQLGPDAMKIDQRLIRPMIEHEVSHEIVGSIIGMAKLLDIEVIAEGVETFDHARILAEMGCDTLQGYAFCKPMPIAELEAFCRAWAPEGTAKAG